jgi:hypothetical protein
VAGGCGRIGGQIGGRSAGQQRPEQGVESVYCADPGLGQVDPPLIQHGQGVGMAFGLQGPGVALQHRHARCRRCVDAVILPPPPRES